MTITRPADAGSGRIPVRRVEQEVADVELRHLRSFVAVAEELHFGRAAERLFINQPALSKQISALEKELRVRLFERTKRQVSLTPAGAALLDDARQLLAQADGAVARAHLASTGITGVLRIGFVAPTLYDLLPRSLRAYREAFPGVRIQCEELTGREGAEGVLSRRLDLALVRLPVAPRAGLGCEQVAVEPVMVAVAQDDPLAERTELELGALSEHSIILIARTHEPELHDHYIAACTRAGFSPNVVHEVARTHLAVGLVAAGLGVAFVPASARLMAHPQVVYRPLVAPRLTVVFGVVWNSRAPRPVLANFLAMRPWGDPGSSGGGRDDAGPPVPIGVYDPAPDGSR